MGFEANRQQVFSKRIVDLPDQPDMSARDLKAYFDSSAEELRQSFNGLCDALIDFSAAAKMGYHESAGVPAQTVQGAIENVQKQVRDASVGKLPSGCVDGDKLAQDVRDRFTAIENSVQAEAATRSNMDATLQQRLEQAGQVLTCKAEITASHYIGDGQANREIKLGYRLPPSEENFFKLYSWHVRYDFTSKTPQVFTRMMARQIYPMFKHELESMGYCFVEE